MEIVELVELVDKAGLSLRPDEARMYLDALGQVEEGLLDLPYPPVPSASARPDVARTIRAAVEERADVVNCFITRCRIEGAKQGILAGKTVGLKDHISVAGVPLTLGSHFMKGFIPDEDATVVHRILHSGGDIVGKLNMDEFSRTGHGFGAGVDGYGRCLNPWGLEHLSGGSSSGSAAAVASGVVDLALGGDQGGSIRIPAAWCGVVGLKPTHGLVPHTGIIGIEPTIDHVGPIGRTAEDVARLLQAVAGPDGRDWRQSCARTTCSYVNDLKKDTGSLRIGILAEGFGDPQAEHDVDHEVMRTANKLEQMGMKLCDISLPAHLECIKLLPAISFVGTYLFWKTHGLSNFTGYADARFVEDFGAYVGDQDRMSALPPIVKLCILLGEHLHSRALTTYARAQQMRSAYRDAVDEVFKDVDCLMMPTVPIKAPRYAPPEDNNEAVGRALFRKLSQVVTRNTASFNITGHPALTVPCAISAGLPIGVMLVGPYFSESLLMQLAAHVQQVNGVETEWYSP
jgi:amidase